MLIYWDYICVAIYGYNSESKFYTDFINEMDNSIPNERIEVIRLTRFQESVIIIIEINFAEQFCITKGELKMDFEFDFEDVIKDFNSFENFTDYDENAWDYMGDDDVYERTKDWDFPYNGEDWSGEF